MPDQWHDEHKEPTVCLCYMKIKQQSSGAITEAYNQKRAA